MQMTDDQIGAMTVPLAAAVILTAIAFVAMQGCKESEQTNRERIKSEKEVTLSRQAAGMIEVYDPVAHKVMWTYATNVSVTVLK